MIRTQHPRGHRAPVLIGAILVAVGAASSAHAQSNDWFTKSRFDALRLLAPELNGTGIWIGQLEPGTPRPDHVTLAGRTLIRRSATVDINNGHATQVAGIMAGNNVAQGGGFRGVATAASVQSAHWRREDTTGDPLGAMRSWEQGFKNSIDWLLLAPRPSVVNISAGSDWDDPEAERIGVVLSTDWMVAAHGITVVAAAGNEGTEAGPAGLPAGFGTITSPGMGFNVLTVGATNTGGTTMAETYQRVVDFSSRGPTRRVTGPGTFESWQKPDLVAPGVGVNSPNATTTTSFAIGGAANGTSFATPQVTGTVALLQQHGNTNGLSTDPRVMRAVLMNSTNKSVKELDGTRVDRNPNLGRGATPLSSTAGTGQLDAVEAYHQYKPGAHGPTFRGADTSGPEVPTLAWDLDTATGQGTGNSNDYRVNQQLRKGSYAIATLSWNRGVNTAANLVDWSYRDLNNMDLGIARLGSITTILERSSSPNNSNEHLVYKLADRDKYYFRVWNENLRDGAASDYALAWKTWGMPTNDYRCFNGDFSGDRGGLVDNGWYPVGNGVTFAVPSFSAGFENHAVCLDASNGASAVAQEMLRPGDFFELTFDYAFTSLGNSGIEVLLGGINLLNFDEFDGSVLLPDVAQLNMFQNYAYMFDLDEIFGGGPLPDYTELVFRINFSSPGATYLDNICYVPAPTALAIVPFGVLAAGCRRRRT